MQALYPPILDPITVAGASAKGGRLYLGDNNFFSIRAKWPTGLVGTIGLEFSIDGDEYEPDTDSEQAVTDVGSFLWNFSGAGFLYARTYFTWTSGSGTITVKASEKGRR